MEKTTRPMTFLKCMKNIFMIVAVAICIIFTGCASCYVEKETYEWKNGREYEWKEKLLSTSRKYHIDTISIKDEAIQGKIKIKTEKKYDHSKWSKTPVYEKVYETPYKYMNPIRFILGTPFAIVIGALGGHHFADSFFSDVRRLEKHKKRLESDKRIKFNHEKVSSYTTTPVSFKIAPKCSLELIADQAIFNDNEKGVDLKTNDSGLYRVSLNAPVFFYNTENAQQQARHLLKSYALGFKLISTNQIEPLALSAFSQTQNVNVKAITHGDEKGVLNTEDKYTLTVYKITSKSVDKKLQNLTVALCKCKFHENYYQTFTKGSFEEDKKNALLAFDKVCKQLISIDSKLDSLLNATNAFSVVPHQELDVAWNNLRQKIIFIEKLEKINKFKQKTEKTLRAIERENVWLNSCLRVTEEVDKRKLLNKNIEKSKSLQQQRNELELKLKPYEEHLYSMFILKKEYAPINLRLTKFHNNYLDSIKAVFHAALTASSKRDKAVENASKLIREALKYAESPSCLLRPESEKRLVLYNTSQNDKHKKKSFWTKTYETLFCW